MFSSTNLAYIAEVYTKFSQNPSSVAQSWQDYFNENPEDVNLIKQELQKASWNRNKISVIGNKNELSSLPAEEQNEKPKDSKKEAKKEEKLKDEQFIKVRDKSSVRHAFRHFGHLAANLDPLGFKKPYFHQVIQDVIRESGEPNEKEKLYIGNIGYEITHVRNHEEYKWLETQIESNAFEASKKEKIAGFEMMLRAEIFEQAIHKKFPGAKRFSIEGAESTIVALESIMLEASNGGAKEVILGMAHRGRLNTLVHTTGKPYHAIFSEFAGVYSIPDGTPGSGDVKYHLGYAKTRTLLNGKELYVTLTPNPSHLEAVNPVVMGRARARQDESGNTNATLPILIHGDAAMAGQGIVYECFQMANLQGYGVGGTIHITINNQVGFTAVQSEGLSGQYCTDVAKVIEAPVFHVNGNDVDSIIKVAKIAALYRQTFKKDVVIEVFAYRKYGHNEGDEPLFTQPVMYGKIKEMVTPAQVYRANIAHEFEAKILEDLEAKIITEIESEFEKSKTYKPTEADWLKGKWSDIKILTDESEFFNFKKTQISQTTFDKVGGAISSVPENFDINPKVRKLLEGRQKALLEGKDIDWGTAELLAYGSLVLEGHNVRLSGEDCERGTFSHRHSVYIDQKDGKKYSPLNNIEEGQAKYYVYNSILSEFGVLGYEYGYAMNDPKNLVIWEAQFGDFANGAVTIHDQFISSGEDKWLRMNGLVNLLPHGFEGQGPEHSSARLERFLAFCAQNNMIVANCTTPANLFHILRRQVKMPFRKPLVIMSPKSLLRHPLVVSTGKDFTQGSFQEIISETNTNAKKIVITSGKVYYDLLAERDLRKSDVAIIRIEQYYPFNVELLKSMLSQFKNVQEVVWLQEEPKNMGAWSFIRDYLQEATKLPVKFCGRKASPSPATGFASVHLKEQKAIVDEALSEPKISTGTLF